MNALIAAELRKAAATRAVWWLTAAAVACCVAWATMQVLVFDPADVTAAYSMAQQGYPAVMIIGILLVAGEYRHRTVTWAFLVTPRRGRVITAKLLAGGVVGLVVGVLATAVTTPLTVILLSIKDGTVFTAEVPAVLLGSTAGTALWCVFGAAVAALVRNQSASVAVALVWTFYVEWILIMLAPAIGRWTPTGAAKAASGWTRVDLPTPGELLPVWAGALVFLAYTLVAAVLARTTVRRDIT